MACVRRVLDRHTLGKPPHPSSLLDSSPDIVKPIIIILGGLKADAIRLASLRTAVQLVPLIWMLLLGVICAVLLNVAPCSALAAVGHRVCTKALHPDGLLPSWPMPAIIFFMISNLVSVLFIFCEVPQRIIAKTVLHLKLVDLDILEACGALQVGAGCDAIQ